MRSFFGPRVIFLLALMLLISGCTASAGASSNSIPPPSPTNTPVPEAPPALEITPTATPAPVGAPTIAPPPRGKAGGSLTVAGTADFLHRDVHQESGESLAAAGPGMAYSRLLRLRTGPHVRQPSLDLECDLCRSWRLTPDFSYEFQLRDDVHWQNIAPVNGRLLVADDLVFSYQRMQTPGWPQSHLFSSRGIGSFEATGPHTLRLKLDFMDSDALLSLADGRSKVAAREVVERYGDLRDSPVVGSGPWIWEQSETGVGVTLMRNPDYFEPGLPFLDRLDFRVVRPSAYPSPVSQARLAAFQAGLVDVVTLPPEQWRQIYHSKQEFNSVTSLQAGSGVMLALNSQDSLLRDVRVRRAVFRALDPWEYVELIWQGQGDVGVGMPAADADWLLGRKALHSDYFASPSQSRQLLSAAGLLTPVDIELAVGDLGSEYQKLGLQVAADLRSAGFNPTIRPLHPSHYAQALQEDDPGFQIVLGAMPASATTNAFLLGMLHSQGPHNLARHEDTYLDEMIDRQASELNREVRRVQLREIQRYILEQGYMFSPVMGGHRWVFNWDLRDFSPNTALSEYHYWSRAWLEP